MRVSSDHQRGAKLGNLSSTLRKNSSAFKVDESVRHPIRVNESDILEFEAKRKRTMV